MEDYLFLPALTIVGALASFINMMAGGGSILTLGLMMIMGVDPTVANGTNRIGVIVGTGSGAAAFRSEKISNITESLILAAFAIPGAVIGSFYSIKMDDILFQRLLAIVMIFILFTMFMPKKMATNKKRKKKKYLVYPAMFIVGFYGGFIQAGVGFLIMASLRHLMDLDLLKTNMHKVFIVCIYTIPVLAIFGFTGNINWTYALCMSIGNFIGSWLSVKLAIKKGEKFVKLVLALSIIVMAAKFLLTL